MYQMDPKTSRTIGSLADWALCVSKLLQTIAGLIFFVNKLWQEKATYWNLVQEIKSFQFVTVCPPTVSLPKMDGFWQIVHISRASLVGVFTEVEQLIDRVSLGGPVYTSRTLGDLLRTGELPHCMTLTVLADPFPTPVEYAYGSLAGRRSIVGKLTSSDGRHLSFEFGGGVELRTALIYTSPSDDVLVFAELDAMPKCSNIMVMRRNQSYEGRLYSQLVSQGSSPPSNPLISIPCP